ncbi:YobA family protein [Sutcliffiella horikoshii]|uniref:DUF3221 domain-containing protein n=1 Tax=Sutcliffiella horikoshii TaxID=79883 RepID=UPI000A499A01|nr:DUF3221 domain-containing protein [Sutcliffiella horikoshii]MCM3620079.1 YobA family protein [Sutcliffiella horikoshii]
MKGLLIGMAAVIGVIMVISFMVYDMDTKKFPKPVTMEMIGYVVAMEDEKMLVVSDMSKEEIQQLTVDEMIAKSEQSAWFSISGEAYERPQLYDLVKVEYYHMGDSKPGQGEAAMVEIMEE